MLSTCQWLSTSSRTQVRLASRAAYGIALMFLTRQLDSTLGVAQYGRLILRLRIGAVAAYRDTRDIDDVSSGTSTLTLDDLVTSDRIGRTRGRGRELRGRRRRHDQTATRHIRIVTRTSTCMESAVECLAALATARRQRCLAIRSLPMGCDQFRIGGDRLERVRLLTASTGLDVATLHGRLAYTWLTLTAMARVLAPTSTT